MHIAATLFVLGVAGLASCGGGGGGTAVVAVAANQRHLTSQPQTICELGSRSCGTSLPYTDGDQLVLSPTSPADPQEIEISVSDLVSGEPLAQPPALPAAVTDGDSLAAAINNFRGGPLLPADVILQDQEIRLAGDATAVTVYTSSFTGDDAFFSAKPLIFCVDDTTGFACLADDFVNAPFAYDYQVRYPGELAQLRDGDGVGMGRYAILKTTRSNDYVVFGTALSLNHVAQVTATNAADESYTYGRYRPVEMAAFVEGNERRDPLPPRGYAAYLGFANAYASSSNRNFLPFQTATDQAGAFFGAGHSAMVFSFDGQGASFESGYIDLFGPAIVDLGVNTDILPNLAEPAELDIQMFSFSLIGRFANPQWLDIRPVGVRSNARGLPTAADYVANPHKEVEIGEDRRRCRPLGETNTCSRHERSSGLAFRLLANSATAERLDFTMELYRVPLRNPANATCYAPDADVVCYPSSNAPGGGAGQLDLYGEGADLTINTEVDGAPIFAAGVWQYNQLVYVDTKGTETASDDELLGVVDLLGSLGGLVHDADPGPLPATP